MSALLVLGLPGCGSGDDALRAGTLQVSVDRCNGVARQRAVAVVVGDALAATVAHPFVDDKGLLDVERITVTNGGDHSSAATVVYLDPTRDLALLRVDDTLPATRLHDATDDDTLRLAHYRPDDSGEARLVIAEAQLLSNGSVSLEGVGERDALGLAADIEPGDSGAPVLDDDGQVVGLVFAVDRDGKRGWAIAASEYVAAMAQLEDNADVAPVSRC